MRKLNVLNANREPVGLDTVIYTNKTIDEVVYIDSDGTEVTLRMIHDEAYVFVTDPSAEKQAEWLASYNARSSIVKETYTIREVLELNMISNGFFDINSTDGISIFNGGTIEIEDGKIKHTTDDSDSYCGFNFVLSMTQYDNYYASFRGFPTDKNYALQTLYTYVDLITVAANQEEQMFSILFNNDNASTGGIVFKQYNALTEYSSYFDDIILINTKYFDEFMTKGRLDYITSLYVRIKYAKTFDGKLFAPSAKTKFDVAYINKTIDDVEYTGPSGKQYTLRDIFGDGAVDNYGGKENLFPNADFRDGLSGYSFQYCTGSIVDGKLFLDNDLGSSYPAAPGLSCPTTKTLIDGNTFYVKIVYETTNDNGTYFYVRNFTKDYNLSVGEHTYVRQGSELTEYSTTQLRLNLGVPTGDVTDNDNLYITNMIAYQLEDMFDAGDIPEQTIFEQLLELWFARKDLKSTLTFEDIFVTANLVSDMFFDDGKGNVDKHLSEQEIEVMSNYLKIYATVAGGYGGYLSFQITSTKVESGKQYYLSYLLDSSRERSIHISFNTAGSAVLYHYNVPAGEYQENIIVTSDYDYNYLRLYQRNTEYEVNDYVLLRHAAAIRVDIFDESITLSKLNELMEEYKLIRKAVVEPEIYVITEPGPGLGGRYKMKKVGDFVYGHEFDFEKISFSMNFGINFNAYEGYNLVRQLLKDNVGVIEYDWGKGSRYADVRLLAAPKTEKDTGNLLTNKWQFELLNPFYELKSLNPSSVDLITNMNTHELAVKPYIRINVTSTTPMIELENDDTSNIDQQIRFDFTGVSTPFEVIIDCENKKITFADGSNAYGYLNMNYNSFFELIYNTPYVLYPSGCTILEWTQKQWVID